MMAFKAAAPAPKDTGIRAAVFSKYPEQFLAGVIERLRECGVTVAKTFNPQRDKPSAFGDCNAILFMYQMSNAGERERTKKAADKAHLPFILLSRHFSEWDKQLEPLIEKLGGAKIERVKAPEIVITKRRGLNSVLCEQLQMPVDEATPPEPVPPPPSEPEQEVVPTRRRRVVQPKHMLSEAVDNGEEEITSPEALLSGNAPPPAPESAVVKIAKRVEPEPEPEKVEEPKSEPAIPEAANSNAHLGDEYTRLLEEENVQLRAKVSALETEVGMYRPQADALHALAVLERFFRRNPFTDAA